MSHLGRRSLIFMLAFLTLAGAAGPARPLPGGAIWIPTLPVFPQSETNVSLFSDGTGYSWSSNGPGYAFKTSDFGTTWKPQEAPPFTATGTIRYGTPDVGFATANGVVFKTIDGGRHWKTLDGPVQPNHLVIYGLGVAPGGDTVVLSADVSENLDNPPAISTLFVSDDAGETWRRKDIPLAGWIDRFAFYDETRWAGLGAEFHYKRTPGGYTGTSFRNVIELTTDGGLSYREALSCPQVKPKEGCTSVGLASPTRIVVGWADGSTSVSDDGGITFNDGQRLEGFVPQEPPISGLFWVMGIAFANSSVGYATTNGGGTWRTGDGGRTWKMERSPEMVYGIGLGEIAVADGTHAIVGDPTFVATRNGG